MATQTFTEAEATLEAEARRIMASENVSYPQAYAAALERNPQLYDAMDQDPAGHVQALQRQSATRQATETAAYTPGVAIKDAANDRIDKVARQLMASENIGYEPAYAKALEQNPRLYDMHVEGERLQSFAEAHPGVRLSEPALEPRQFGGNDAMWRPTSTPAGQAAGRRGQALEGRLNKLVTAILDANPGLPYVCAVARAFDADRGPWKECRAFRV